MFLLTNSKLDAEQLKGTLLNTAAGACVTFEGWVRNTNDGRTVHRLEYESYHEVAKKEGERVLLDALERFGVLDVHCVHRVGVLEIGDMAVWVGVSAGHRGEAFEACRYIIDEIKTRVPIWKKEFYADGDSGWVNAESRSGPV